MIVYKNKVAGVPTDGGRRAAIIGLLLLSAYDPF